MPLHDFDGAIDDFKTYKKKRELETVFIRAKNVDEFIGIASKMKGDYNGAINFFDRCVAEAGKPSWVDVYVLMYRGLCYEALGDTINARKDFEEMIKQCDSCPEGYYYLARNLKMEDQEVHAKRIRQLLTTALSNKRMLRYWVYYEHFDQVYVEDIEAMLAG